ncbi:MAG: hypothetical protein ACPID3_01455, partial [Paracoccaceae bacterium]
KPLEIFLAIDKLYSLWLFLIPKLEICKILKVLRVDEIKKFFEPVLQRIFLMSELALVGEGHDGNFHVICQTPFGQKSKK